MLIKLTEARKAGGYTKYRLAKLSGVSQSFIGKIEKGTENPSSETLEKLANALKISIKDLF